MHNTQSHEHDVHPDEQPLELTDNVENNNSEVNANIKQQFDAMGGQKEGESDLLKIHKHLSSGEIGYELTQEDRVPSRQDDLTLHDS